MSIFYLDAFGNFLTFKYNGHYKQKSYLGIVFTFIFIFMMCFFTMFYIKRYINYEDIQVYEITNKYQLSQGLILNDDFSFALNSYSEKIDDLSSNKYFYMKSYYKKYENHKEVNSQVINLEKCSKDKWKLKNSDYTDYELTNETCFNFIDLELGGNKMFGNYSNIEVNFYLNFKIGEFEYNKMVEAEISENPKQILTKLIETKYNYEDENHQESSFLRHKEFKIDYEFFTEIDFYFSEDKFKVLKDNLFIEEFNEINFFNLKEIEKTYNHPPVWNKYREVYFGNDLPNFKIDSSIIPNEEKEESNRKILQFNLYSHDKSETTTYTRKRLVEYVSQLGGLFNFLFIIFSFICSLMNQQYFKYKIVIDEMKKLNESKSIKTQINEKIREESKVNEVKENNIDYFNNEKSENIGNLKNESKLIMNENSSSFSSESNVNFKFNQLNDKSVSNKLIKMNMKSNDASILNESNIYNKRERNYSFHLQEEINNQSKLGNVLNLNEEREKENYCVKNRNSKKELMSFKDKNIETNISPEQKVQQLLSTNNLNNNVKEKEPCNKKILNELKQKNSISNNQEFNKQIFKNSSAKLNSHKSHDIKKNIELNSNHDFIKKLNSLSNKKFLSYCNFLCIKTLFRISFLDCIFMKTNCWKENKIKQELIKKIEEYFNVVFDIKEYLPLYFTNKFLRKKLLMEEQINCLEKLDFFQRKTLLN